MKNPVRTLLYIVATYFLFCFLSGCKTKTVYIPVEKTRLVKEVETIHDTIVEIKLVPYYKEKTTAEDSSYLENEYAYSSAHWDGALLHHNLGIFDKKIPVEIQYKDRNIYIHDSIPVPYPVVEYIEVNQLSSFQSFQIWCGRILLIVIIAWFGLNYVRKLI